MQRENLNYILIKLTPSASLRDGEAELCLASSPSRSLCEPALVLNSKRRRAAVVQDNWLLLKQFRLMQLSSSGEAVSGILDQRENVKMETNVKSNVIFCSTPLLGN